MIAMKGGHSKLADFFLLFVEKLHKQRTPAPTETTPASTEAATKEQWFTALQNYNRKAIYTLIESGVDLDQQDHFGRTALMCTLVYNDSKLTTTLLTSGADPDVQDKSGETALMMVPPVIKSHTGLFC